MKKISKIFGILSAVLLLGGIVGCNNTLSSGAGVVTIENEKPNIKDVVATPDEMAVIISWDKFADGGYALITREVKNDTEKGIIGYVKELGISDTTYYVDRIDYDNRLEPDVEYTYRVYNIKGDTGFLGTDGSLIDFTEATRAAYVGKYTYDEKSIKLKKVADKGTELKEFEDNETDVEFRNGVLYIYNADPLPAFANIVVKDGATGAIIDEVKYIGESLSIPGTDFGKSVNISINKVWSSTYYTASKSVDKKIDIPLTNFAVTGLKAEYSAGSVVVSWNEIKGAKYKVYRADGTAFGAYEEITANQTTKKGVVSVVDADVDSLVDSNYVYTVVAYTDNGYGYGQAVLGEAEALVIPLTVGYSAKEGGVVVTWPEIDGAEYKLFRAKGNDKNTYVPVDLTKAKVEPKEGEASDEGETPAEDEPPAEDDSNGIYVYVDKDVKKNTTYWYKLEVVTPVATGKATASCDTGEPAAPYDISATYENGSVVISWTSEYSEFIIEKYDSERGYVAIEEAAIKTTPVANRYIYADSSAAYGDLYYRVSVKDSGNYAAVCYVYRDENSVYDVSASYDDASKSVVIKWKSLASEFIVEKYVDDGYKTLDGTVSATPIANCYTISDEVSSYGTKYYRVAVKGSKNYEYADCVYADTNPNTVYDFTAESDPNSKTVILTWRSAAKSFVVEKFNAKDAKYEASVTGTPDAAPGKDSWTVKDELADYGTAYYRVSVDGYSNYEFAQTTCSYSDDAKVDSLSAKYDEAKKAVVLAWTSEYKEFTVEKFDESTAKYVALGEEKDAPEVKAAPGKNRYTISDSGISYGVLNYRVSVKDSKNYEYVECVYGDSRSIYDFTAEGTGFNKPVVLTWYSTSSEFTVEKYNGTEFAALEGTVTVGPYRDSWTIKDNKPSYGMNYYRVKIKDTTICEYASCEYDDDAEVSKLTAEYNKETEAIEITWFSKFSGFTVEKYDAGEYKAMEDIVVVVPRTGKYVVSDSDIAYGNTYYYRVAVKESENYKYAHERYAPVGETIEYEDGEQKFDSDSKTVTIKWTSEYAKDFIVEKYNAAESKFVELDVTVTEGTDPDGKVYYSAKDTNIDSYGELHYRVTAKDNEKVTTIISVPEVDPDKIQTKDIAWLADGIHLEWYSKATSFVIERKDLTWTWTWNETDKIYVKANTGKESEWKPITLTPESNTIYNGKEYWSAVDSDVKAGVTYRYRVKVSGAKDYVKWPRTDDNKSVEIKKPGINVKANTVTLYFMPNFDVTTSCVIYRAVLPKNDKNSNLENAKFELVKAYESDDGTVALEYDSSKRCYVYTDKTPSRLSSNEYVYYIVADGVVSDTAVLVGEWGEANVPSLIVDDGSTANEDKKIVSLGTETNPSDICFSWNGEESTTTYSLYYQWYDGKKKAWTGYKKIEDDGSRKIITSDYNDHYTAKVTMKDVGVPFDEDGEPLLLDYKELVITVTAKDKLEPYEDLDSGSESVQIFEVADYLTTFTSVYGSLDAECDFDGNVILTMKGYNLGDLKAYWKLEGVTQEIDGAFEKLSEEVDEAPTVRSDDGDTYQLKVSGLTIGKNYTFFVNFDLNMQYDDSTKPEYETTCPTFKLDEWPIKICKYEEEEKFINPYADPDNKDKPEGAFGMTKISGASGVNVVPDDDERDNRVILSKGGDESDDESKTITLWRNSSEDDEKYALTVSCWSSGNPTDGKSGGIYSGVAIYSVKLADDEYHVISIPMEFAVYNAYDDPAKGDVHTLKAGMTMVDGKNVVSGSIKLTGVTAVTFEESTLAITPKVTLEPLDDETYLLSLTKDVDYVSSDLYTGDIVCLVTDLFGEQHKVKVPVRALVGKIEKPVEVKLNPNDYWNNYLYGETLVAMPMGLIDYIDTDGSGSIDDKDKVVKLDGTNVTLNYSIYGSTITVSSEKSPYELGLSAGTYTGTVQCVIKDGSTYYDLLVPVTLKVTAKDLEGNLNFWIY